MGKPSTSLVGISILLLTFFLAGCGSSSPNITITLTPSTSQTIDQGQSVNITAALTNDSSNKGVTWSLSGPGTLANKTSNSVIYDAPTTLQSAASVTVTATAVADTSATATLSIAVNPGPTITTTSLPSGAAGTAYSQTLTESGGTAPFTWGVISGQMPPGLTLNAGGGQITGTPTGAGTFNFTVQLSDEARLTTTKALSITIAAPPALAVTTTALPNGAVNVSYNAVLAASGGVPPYSWSLSSGSLPPGLDLKASGVISGTPTTTGTSTFTVQASDSETPTAATATQTLTLTVNPVPYSITTTSLPNGTVGIAYGTTLQVSGGVPPNTWTVVSGALPSWATLDSSTGVISGTPTATGTTDFTVEATDSESSAATATQALSITITATQDGLLAGHYAFALGGYRGGLAGTIVADGKGKITGGTEDLENTAAGLNAVDMAITSGSYAVGTDYRGTLTYTDANGNTFTFDLALTPVSSAVATKGAIIETDLKNNFTGFIYLQDQSAFSTSAMSGNYVFDLSGWDATGNANVELGIATVANGAVSGGHLDENDAGTVKSNVSFSGTLSVNSSGRGTVTSSTAQANFTFYVVSSSEWVAIATNTSTGAVATGLVQSQSTGVYSDSSVTGTVVVADESSTSTPAPQAIAGLLTSSGDGSGNFTFDVDAGGALSSEAGTATFTFDTAVNGRFTMTLQTPAGSSPYVGYMVAPGKAVIASTGSRPSLGSFDPQEAPPFSNTSLTGSFFFGSQPLVAAPSATQSPILASGEMTFDGNGGFNSTTDSIQGTTVTTSQLTGTYTVGSNGRVTLVPGTSILYVISSSKSIILSTGPASFPNPFIQVVER